MIHCKSNCYVFVEPLKWSGYWCRLLKPRAPVERGMIFIRDFANFSEFAVFNCHFQWQLAGNINIATRLTVCDMACLFPTQSCINILKKGKKTTICLGNHPINNVNNAAWYSISFFIVVCLNAAMNLGVTNNSRMHCDGHVLQFAQFNSTMWKLLKAV